MKSLLRPLAVAPVLLACASLSVGDTLSDIYELAVNNDAKMKAAEATYRANLETEKQAFSAMLPQVTAEAYYRENDTETSSPTTNFNQGTGNFEIIDSESDTDTDTDGYTISLRQTMFNLDTWFTFKSSKEISKQAQAQFAADQQGLMLRTSEAYFNVLRAIDNLQASKAEERATKRQLEQTQQRFDVGLIAITDVHEARAAYDSSVVLRLTDEGNVGTAYEALSVLSGQSHANLWLLNKDFPVIDPTPLERSEWVAFSLENNFQLKAAQFGAEAAKQQATAKKMGHLPTVTGSFSYSDDSTDGTRTSNPTSTFNVPPSSETESQSVNITLSLPLFSGGAVSSRRRQAYEQYNAAHQTAIDTQRTVIQQTRSLHLTVTTDVQRVKARDQSIVSTQSALEATQAGYEVGTRNVVDVLQAQRSLYSAIRDHANSRYAYVINMLKLKQQAGTLSPQDLIDLNKWLVAPAAPSASQYKEFQY